MVFQLKFNDELAISPLANQDNLVWHVFDLGEFFISKEYLQDLNVEYHILSRRIGKQVINNQL